MPSGSAVGRSLSECTARSTSPASSASRSAETKTPVPPIWASASRLVSPYVVTGTSSTARPVRAVIASATSCACAVARALRRVPSRRAVTRHLRRAALGADVGPGDGLDRRRVELEELVQRVGVGLAAGLLGELLHPHGRGVQQLVDDPADGLLDLGPGPGVEVGQPAVQPDQLGLRPRRRPCRAARPRSGRRWPRAASRGTPRPPRPRSRGSPRRRRRARWWPSTSASDSRSTTVTPGTSWAAGLDVAGQREVEHDQRPARPRRRPRRPAGRRTSTWPTAPVQETTRSASGERRGQLGERHGLAADRGGDPLGPRPGCGWRRRPGRRRPAATTLADSALIAPAPTTSTCGAVERAEDPPGLVQAGGHQRAAGAVDAGLGAGPLADPQGLLGEGAELPPGGAGVLRGAQRRSGPGRGSGSRRRPSSPGRRPPRTGARPRGPRSARRGAA